MPRSLLSVTRLLLDTHAALFWWSDAAKLGATARDAITEAETVLVSAASAWEIATKHRLGKLGGIGELATSFRRLLRSNGFEELNVTVDHVLTASALIGAHGDPFDRLIAAQGMMENAVVVTRDRELAGLGCATLW